MQNFDIDSPKNLLSSRPGPRGRPARLPNDGGGAGRRGGRGGAQVRRRRGPAGRRLRRRFL